MLSLSVITGLIVMFLWGIGSFLTSIPTRKIGTLKTMFTSSLLGLIPTTILIPIFWNSLNISLGNFIFLTIGGICMIIALYNFYSAMEIGEVSIISVIGGSYSIMTVVLAVLFLGESMTTFKVIAMFLIFIGVVLTSVDIKKLKKIHTIKGVKLAFLSLFFSGINYFLLSVVGRDIIFLGINSVATGIISIYVFTGLINQLLFMAFVILKKQVPTIKEVTQKSLLLIFFTTMVMFSVAWLALNYGMSKGNVSIVMPITSLNPAITVILAVIFYKEKLVLNQKLGILVVLSGLVLISM